MSPRQHQVTVEIAGEKHVLRSDAPPDYTRAAAAHVDAKLAALPGNLDGQRRAILAALAVTDELFRAREEIRQLREDAERGMDTLVARLQQGLEEAEKAP